MSKFSTTKKIKRLELRNPISSNGSIISTNEINAKKNNSVLDKGLDEGKVGVISLPFPVLSLSGYMQLKAANPKVRFRKIDPTGMNLDKFDTIQEIIVPNMKGFNVSSTLTTLNPITAAANELLKYIQEFKTTPENKELACQIQNAVLVFMRAISKVVGGKQGLIRRELFETRVQRSLGAIAVPNITLKPYEIGIGRNKTAIIEGIKHKPIFCIVDREPNLWMGSIQVMELVILPFESEVIHVNPFCHREFGLDFDGDRISLVVPPHTESTISELQTLCGFVTFEYGSWSEEFLLNGKESKIDWKNPQADLANRTQTRFTLTPREILEGKGPYLDACVKTGAKKIPSDFKDYASGITLPQFKKMSEDAVLQLTRMKREIGVVGALTDKLTQLTLALDPKKLPKALMVKEYITQLLLDSKTGSAAFDSHRLVDLFNKRNNFLNISRQGFTEALRKMGFDGARLKDLEKILDDVWPYLPLDNAISSILPTYELIKKRDVTSMLTVGNEDDGECITHVIMSYINELKPKNITNVDEPGRCEEELPVSGDDANEAQAEYDWNDNQADN